MYVLQSLLQGLGQLVRAGGGLKAAADAFQLGNGLFGVHTLYQGADAFQIAIASAYELNVVNPSVLQIE